LNVHVNCACNMLIFQYAIFKAHYHKVQD